MELEEQEDMVEVAGLVGAANVQSMAALGAEGLAAGRASVGRGGSSSVDILLQQLRQEPTDEQECTAKFLLYEGYASEVEQMRGTLLRFHEETIPSVPAAIAADMNKQIKGIDSTEAMGIPDGAREWFVFWMMRQAERNNLGMAGILENFEKKIGVLGIQRSDRMSCVP